MSDGFRVPAGEALPYTAAGQGRRLRIWRTPNSGPNASLSGLGIVRSRARSAARNDPWAGAALDKSVANGIGVGIQAKPLGGTDAERADLKALWRQSLGELDADGVLDLYGLQALAWREWREAGEVFARIRYRRQSDGLRVPVQVQLIEAEQCPHDHYAQAPNGNQIRAGVEFDRIGRRTAYWMYRAHPGEIYTGIVNAAELVRIPAEEVIHLYRPLRAGQIRGVPDAAAVLVRMFQLDRLDDKVLERQNIANLFTGWYVSKSEASDDAGVTAGMVTEEDEDGTPLAGMEPGTMQELPPGVEPKFSNPPGPGDTYAEFVRGHLMAIAARHGVPYEVLTGDLRDVSDRSLRLILNEFRRAIEMDQWLYMIPMFCTRVRAAWLDQAVLSGAIQLPGYAERRAELTDTLWVPQGWPYSHPVQDVDADIKAIRSGLTSRGDVVMSNGDDVEEIDAEQAEDNARADRLGLVYDSDGRRKRGEGAQDKAAPTSDATPTNDKGS
jgi:lambda family phage portal protein